MSNFDLADAVKSLPIKHFRGVFMKDQLPERPKIQETGIINLDNHTGLGTHWTCYGISPSSIIYFDSYGLPPPREFIKYVSKLREFQLNEIQLNKKSKIPIWYSTLPTQTLTDPPICGREVLNALTAISTTSLPIHNAVHEYSLKRNSTI